MRSQIDNNSLIIPVYINEKIVIDMLAILEDGFSMVSQVNYIEHKEDTTKKALEAGASTSATLLSKLLRINISGGMDYSGKNETKEDTTKEKIHTNVSLLYKFRSYLISKKLLHTEEGISHLKVGDFVETEGELQKNPLIYYLEAFTEMLHLADVFADIPATGEKNKARDQRQKQAAMMKQIQQFTDELKKSGTIDFVLSDNTGTVVLSAQEQYLANDNISEIIGGKFRVMGKVISVVKDSNSSIDLLRKTALSYLPSKFLENAFSGFQTNNDLQSHTLPEFKTAIPGPAIIVIPIAIYA